MEDLKENWLKKIKGKRQKKKIQTSLNLRNKAIREIDYGNTDSYAEITEEQWWKNIAMINMGRKMLKLQQIYSIEHVIRAL